MYDYSKLRGRIKEICSTEQNFASQIGISYAAVINKLQNRTDFKQKEILKICDVLQIQKEDISAYFFAHRL